MMCAFTQYLEGVTCPLARQAALQDMDHFVLHNGVGPKLRKAIERRTGWRGDTWYRHWHRTGPLLEEVLKYRTAHGLRRAL